MEKSLQFRIAKELVEKILNGKTQAGDKLPPEMELCKLYDTSRPTIREAIHMLSTRGIVKARPRAGTIIQPLYNWNILDTLVLDLIKDTEYSKELTLHFSHMRRFIEGEVSYLSALNITEDGKKELFEAFHAMIEVHTENNEIFDHERWIEVDLRFHKIIYQHCGNMVYTAFGNLLHTLWRNEISMASDNQDMCIKEHHILYNSIIQGDANAARDITNILTKHTGEHVDSKIKRKSKSDIDKFTLDLKNKI